MTKIGTNGYNNNVAALKNQINGQADSQYVKTETKPDSVEIEGKKKINKKSVFIAISALAATAGIVYAIKNGKAKKCIDSAKTKIKALIGKDEQAAKAGQEIAEIGQTIAETSQKMTKTAAETCQKGKFTPDPLSMKSMKSTYKTSSALEADWRYNRDHRYYTGKVLAKAKNGNETLLTYKGGVIKKAVTKNPEGNVILEKTYANKLTFGQYGTEFVQIKSKSADGTVKNCAIGNYDHQLQKAYPKFFINSEGKTFIQPGYEKLLEEGSELNQATEKIIEFINKY